mmetsp:Transcript_42922/g.90127  ORF Transcript_42922/g.90127 Transcript_42922/m.90127 type:complete len:239 (-) Transcript_42922:1139-1855(-)
MVGANAVGVSSDRFQCGSSRTEDAQCISHHIAHNIFRCPIPTVLLLILLTLAILRNHLLQHKVNPLQRLPRRPQPLLHAIHRQHLVPRRRRRPRPAHGQPVQQQPYRVRKTLRPPKRRVRRRRRRVRQGIIAAPGGRGDPIDSYERTLERRADRSSRHAQRPRVVLQHELVGPIGTFGQQSQQLGGERDGRGCRHGEEAHHFVERCPHVVFGRFDGFGGASGEGGGGGRFGKEEGGGG